MMNGNRTSPFQSITETGGKLPGELLKCLDDVPATTIFRRHHVDGCADVFPFFAHRPRRTEHEDSMLDRR